MNKTISVINEMSKSYAKRIGHVKVLAQFAVKFAKRGLAMGFVHRNQLHNRDRGSASEEKCKTVANKPLATLHGVKSEAGYAEEVKLRVPGFELRDAHGVGFGRYMESASESPNMVLDRILVDFSRAPGHPMAINKRARGRLIARRTLPRPRISDLSCWVL